MSLRHNIRKWDLAAKAGPRPTTVYQAFRDAWDRVAAAWIKDISRATPRPLSATCDAINVAPFGYWAEKLGGPRGVVVVRSQSLRAPGLLIFSQRAADVFTNALHGGSVSAARRYGDASLDGFGAAILRRVATQALHHFDTTLFQPHQLHFKLTRQETAVVQAAIVRDDEPMLRLQFRVEDKAQAEGQGVSGTVDFLLPEAAVRSIAMRPAVQTSFNPHDGRLSVAALAGAEVTLSAELAATEVDLRELLRLAVGDEIVFDVAADAVDHAPVKVLVEGKERPQIHAEFAVVAGRRVLKIAG